MSMIARSIEVDVPVATAYNQWTQFEEFPLFMEGVERVEQLDDRRLRWHAEIAGIRREWTADIVEQVPDHSIAWRSVEGAHLIGRVVFRPLDARRCNVAVQLDYEPEDAAEKFGTWLGLIERRVEGDLERFKHFIERRGIETGAWRGAI